MENIRILHEDINDGPEGDFARAKGLLTDAEQIRFMGFGFGKTNIERLGLRTMEPRRAKATCIGMTNRERAENQNYLNQRVDFVGGDCLDMLREDIDWD